MSPTHPRQRIADPPPTAAPAERAALLHTLAEMLQQSDAGVELPESAESRERLLRTAERRIWRAADAAQTILARDVGAYVGVLREAGVTSRQALAAVVALVRQAAAPAATGARVDELAHDAGRYCVAACVAR